MWRTTWTEKIPASDESLQEVNTTLETRLPQTAGNALLIWNAIQKFRFWWINDWWFINWVDPTEFDVTKDALDYMDNGGNAWWSSYLRIVKSVFSQDTTTSITSVNKFKMPFRFWIKPSLSQRLNWQDIAIDLVWVDSNWTIETTTPPADLAISWTITIASNVATINFASAHNLRWWMRVVLYWNTEKRLNAWPIYVTVVTSTQITLPITLANWTYTAWWYVKYLCPVWNAKNVFSEVFDNTTVTNAVFWTKRNWSKPRPYTAVPTQNTITTTIWLQSNTSPYTDAWNAWNETEIIAWIEDIIVFDRVIDWNNQNTKRAEFNQTLPDEEVEYKIRIRANNNKNFVAPHCRITNIAKTWTTTATVTTDIPHWLVANDYVQIYWVRDITNFPNLTASTIVASAPTTTTFTIVIGWAVTATSNGWVVAINNWSQLLQWALNLNVQSIVRTNNILTATLNTTATTALPWEFWTLAWLSNGAESYIWAYKVLRITWSTIEFESIWANFGSITTWWAVIKNTELRLHWIVMMDYTRNIVELNTARWSNDVTNAINVLATISNPTSSQPNLAPSATYWHATYHNLISAWSTNATSVKATAWNIWSIVLSNNSASIRYFKLYNKASAPTVWTDIPIQVYMIKWWETIDIIPGWAYWLRCTTWIAYALTWWIANNDTTAILANEVAVAIAYT